MASVQSANTPKTMFTEAQQLELQKRLKGAKSRTEKQSIYEAYLNECGIVKTEQVPKTDSDMLAALMPGVNLSGKKAQPKTEGTVTNTTYQLNELFQRLSIADDDKKDYQTKFLTVLKGIQGVTVNDDGTFSYTTEAKEKIQEAINNFCEENKALYLKSSAPSRVTTGNETLDRNLIEVGVLQQDENGVVTVSSDYKDKITLTTAEPTRTENRDAQLPGTSVTTTNTASNTAVLEPPKGVKLRDDKSARKEYEAAMREQYALWLQEAGNQASADIYIATNKYGKQVEQRMAELRVARTSVSGYSADGKELKHDSKYQMSNAELFDLFLQSLKAEDPGAAEQLEQNITQLAQTTDTKTLQKFQELLKEYSGNRVPSDVTQLSPEDKLNAAKLLVLEGLNLQGDDLLRLMAIQDVMSNRLPEQIESDNKYFIKHQAKDYVRNQQAQQDYADTTVHFSVASRKAGEGGIHTDIGGRGRDLVLGAPQHFCDEISKEEYNKADPKNKGEYLYLNGKYYKFDSDKYKLFMKLACDPTASLDQSERARLKDMNMTLEEGRNGLQLYITNANGKLQPIVTLLGNDNGKVDNSELNAWRHLAEKAGLSTDSNPTYMKRLAEFAKDLAINTALTVGVPLAGNLIGGVANLANNVLPQITQTISGTTSSQKFTTPDKWVYGDPVDWVHNVTDSSGVDLSAEFHAEPQKILVPGETYTINGQEYKAEVSTEVPSGVNLVKVGVVAGGVFAAGWLLNKRDGIHSAGRANDDVYNPVIYRTTEETSDVTDSFKIPQYVQQSTLNITPEFGGYSIDYEKMRARGLSLEQYKTNSPTNRAQAVICNMGAGAIGEGNSFKQPAVISFNDTTNGNRTYEYQRLTDAEIAEQNLDKNNGPYYKLVKVQKTANGETREITSSHMEVYRLDGVSTIPVQQEDGTVSLQISYNLGQYEGMAGSNQTSVRNNKEIQRWW